MIDYAERIERVHEVLRDEYGVTDRQPTEILLAAALPCSLPYPWIILETSYYQLDPAGAWFNSFGGNCVTLASIRTVRPRYSNDAGANILLDRNRPFLFIENVWELPPDIKWRFAYWPLLMQECLKVRSVYPRTKLIDHRAQAFLSAAVKEVREMEWRDTSLIKMPEFPPSLPYYAELLQRLSPDVRSWDILLRNLVSLAGRRAALFNRTVDSTDWAIVSRVMADTVPFWIGEMFRNIGSHGNILKLRLHFPIKTIKEELTRLGDEGLLYTNRGKWYIRDLSGRGRDIINILEGIDFNTVNST